MPMAVDDKGGAVPGASRLPDTPGSAPLADVGDGCLARGCARFVYQGFRDYDRTFRIITRRAAGHFVDRDWAHARDDLVERIDLWEKCLGTTTAGLREALGARVTLARTFFTSVTRRIFDTRGVDPLIEFVLELEPRVRRGASPPSRVYVNWDSLEELFESVLEDFAFGVPYTDIRRDVRFIRDEMIRGSRLHYRGPDTILRVELMVPVFYQSTRAFLVGKVEGEGWTAPLAIALRNSGSGIEVEALLMSDDDMSILFGFTRSCFFVDLETVASAVEYLRALLPDKPIDELYTVLGRIRQGKTERYRQLARHIKRSDEMFVHAPGDEGLVMLVFTLPSHHLVFKVIRDRFGFSKTVTRDQVINRYRFVSRHDRVGRLIDTQAFRNIELPLDRFSPELREELLSEAASTVRRVGDRLAIDLLYMERKLIPLNLYLREANLVRARAAILDYGRAIKELARSNIFPGDMLLKNFGVTRHGRVIFYDFDEIVPMTECRFRAIPHATTDEQELSSEPWFHVDENDVFPEQFGHFLGMSRSLEPVFFEEHADLLTSRFWRGIQAQCRSDNLLAIQTIPCSHDAVA